MITKADLRREKDKRLQAEARVQKLEAELAAAKTSPPSFSPPPVKKYIYTPDLDLVSKEELEAALAKIS